MELDAEAFEAIVVDELDQLPDDMVDGLENVVFVVEDRPEDGSLDLLGLYDGYALTERDRYGIGEMPDRIILYREPLLAIMRRRGASSARRSTSPSCTRSPTSTASTTTGCTTWAGRDASPVTLIP